MTEDGFIEVISASVSGIILFSIILGLSFYQPLVIFFGMSQIKFIAVSWIVVALHILIRGKYYMYARGIL